MEDFAGTKLNFSSIRFGSLISFRDSFVVQGVSVSMQSKPNFNVASE